jgi:hypothetical protein
MDVISKFCNPENPEIEPQNPVIKLALKSCGIPGLDSLRALQYRENMQTPFQLRNNITCLRDNRLLVIVRGRHSGALWTSLTWTKILHCMLGIGKESLIIEKYSSNWKKIRDNYIL